MELDFKNIFIASLLFGKKETTRLVFAQDRDDVVSTLNEYYNDSEIGFVISYEEINELYQLSKSRNDKIFVLVIEMSRAPNQNIFYEYIEWVDDIEDLHNKYKGRDYLFCDKDFIKGLVEESNTMLKNPVSRPLISENISI